MPATFVQTQSAKATGTSVTVTLTLTAGNFVHAALVLAGRSFASASPIVQTAGDALTLDASIDDSGTYVAHYSKASVAGGSTTFTFTFTSDTATLYISEASSIASSSAFDVAATAVQVTATSRTTGTTATLAQADAIAFATWNGDGSGSRTFTSVSNSFTVPTNGDQLTSAPNLLAYKVLSSTSAVESTLQLVESSVLTGIVSVYKGAVATGPTLPWLPVTRVIAGASSRVIASGFIPPSRLG